MKSPIKFFGGKSYIAKDIIRNIFPSPGSYINYIEPFCGGASVFFAATERHSGCCAEILNDKYSLLINFFQVLQDKALFEEFHRIIFFQPFSEESFEESFQYNKIVEKISEKISEEILADAPSDSQEFSMVKRAAAFFICNRMSFAGRMESGDFAAITKKRLRGGRNEQVNAWLNCIDKLPEIALRLQDALILNRDALQVIVEFGVKNSKGSANNTLFYLDPPYLLDTRTNKDGGEYKNEMTYEEHEGLLSILAMDKFKARFLLSCYENKLYSDYAHDFRWNRYEIKTTEKSSGAANERTEIIYTNY